ncbi:transcriptional regulator, partial [Salmonella enterica subsp. enterica serovar Kentucky]|nr:transcriptional regulator [Salmonella enterica subsp. enterica serovar Kentucky]MDI5424771.1 transcriptional regulator [Salmonella enterica subsp. enterica serovar Kentucky]
VETNSPVNLRQLVKGNSPAV